MKHDRNATPSEIRAALCALGESGDRLAQENERLREALRAIMNGDRSDEGESRNVAATALGHCPACFEGGTHAANVGSGLARLGVMLVTLDTFDPDETLPTLSTLTPEEIEQALSALDLP